MPTSTEIAYATSRTLEVLTDDRTPVWVQTYYEPKAAYAGRSFVALEPNSPNEVTAADLYAVSLLNVTVKPNAARRLLYDGEHHKAVTESLAVIPPDADLAKADTDLLQKAEAFYLSVRRALGRDPWVTTSKLCARKRPSLIPVRDDLVTRQVLGMAVHWWTDWLVYQQLISNESVLTELGRLIAGASSLGSADAAIDDPPLRVMDVALWMYARCGGV